MLRNTVIASAALAVMGLGSAYGQVVASTFVINELDSLQTLNGTNDRQFIELFNRGLTPVTLSDFTLAFYDGDAPGNARYNAIRLNAGTLLPGQFYVVGNPGVANVNQTFAAGTLQTGVDAVVLFRGDSPPTIPLPTMILNFTDAIAYGQGTTLDVDLISQTGEIPFQYNENFGATFPGGLTNVGASLNRTAGIDAIPFEIGTPTPGVANNITIPVPAIVQTPEPASMAVLGLAAAGLLRRPRSNV